MQDSSMMGSNSRKYKTMLCRHFQKNGMCQLADKCGFAHGEHELRGDGEPVPQQAQFSVLNNPQYQQMQMMRQQYQMVPQQGNFKTSRCQYFDKGFCKNQDNCMFAHGDQELRNPQYNQQNMMQNNMMGNPQMDQYYQMQQQQQQQQYMMYMQQQNPQYSIESIRQQAMIDIVQKMQNILNYDTEAYHKLQQAVQFIVTNQQDQANLIVQEVMSDSKRTKEEIEQYTAIFAQTSEYLQQQQDLMMQQQQGMVQQPPQQQ